MTNITGGELNSFSTSSKILIDNGDGKISKIKVSNSGIINTHTYTYATLPTTFIPGDFYKITDATKSTNGNCPNGITLILQALSTTVLSFDAKIPDYTEDIISYSYISDTILFRFDTINDHSQYADWRNGLGVSFGGVAYKSHFGKGCSGTLATTPVNVRFGADCVLNIGAVNEISFLNIGNNCSITSTGTDSFSRHTIGDDVILSCINFGTEDGDSKNTIGNNCSISVVGDITGSTIGNGCSIALDGGNIAYSIIPNGCNISLSGHSVTNSVLTPSYSITTNSDVLTFMNSNRNLYTQYAVPTAGSTVTVGYSTNALLLKPAGTLATLTITLPDATDLKEGHKITISSTQIVTALTLSAPTASFVTTATTALAVGVPVSYVYTNLSGSKYWFKC